jgi:hypothetical protein
MVRNECHTVTSKKFRLDILENKVKVKEINMHHPEFNTRSQVFEVFLQSNWNRLSPAQKQQYKSAYYSQIGQNTQSYQTYNQTYNSGSGYKSSSKKSPADQMREYQARQHMFRMMNEMNMNTHATSLNIIENIGGTGNYWSVVDY